MGDIVNPQVGAGLFVDDQEAATPVDNVFKMDAK